MQACVCFILLSKSSYPFYSLHWLHHRSLIALRISCTICTSEACHPKRRWAGLRLGCASARCPSKDSSSEEFEIPASCLLMTTGVEI